MYSGITITPPFFEIGPKVYVHGREALKLAKAADEACRRYNVQIIFSPQYVDIPVIARETRDVLVFAQHIDPVEIGPGIGAVLPEAIKDAGAVGTLLNHSERRMTITDINKTIKRASQVGLLTAVCADTPEEAAAIAHLESDIILAEPPELIGSSDSVGDSTRFITNTMALIKAINPRIRVLIGAGIRNEKDVERVIAQGAEATGSTSGIIKAENPEGMIDQLVRTLRETWDRIHENKE